jgi:hypothetical protein
MARENENDYIQSLKFLKEILKELFSRVFLVNKAKAIRKALKKVFPN